MKKIFLFISFLLVQQAAFSQAITGTWSGKLNVQNVTLPLVLHVQELGDSLVSTMDSPAQGVKGIKVEETVFKDGELSVTMKSISASYKGTFAGDSISGIFTQMGMDMPLVLKKGEAPVLLRPQTPKPPFDYHIEEVSFVNASQQNTLAGTLTTPKDKNTFPVVVTITGSGSQDRDETLFEHKPFWVIADHFAKKGIGVLRLDDRGVGGSSKGKEGATSADFATDIDAAVNYLNGKGFKNIGLLGHSEGAMIGSIVATENKNVKFFISMAGPGIVLDSLYKLQVYSLAKASGNSENVARHNAEQVEQVIRIINQYEGKELEKELRKMINNSFPDSASREQMTPVIDGLVKTYSSPWFVYFIKFDPKNYIEKLTIPVLALNGSLDMQVTSKENLEGWKRLLEKAGNKNFEVGAFPGLNHLFQPAKTGAIDEYNTIEATMDPKVLDTMSNWILKLK